MKVGLEIHGYMDCKEKLFCTCRIDYKAKPNTNICPICTSQPGSKPMLPSKEAMRHISAIGLFLGCKMNSRLQFQRKHYNWPDLPSGYQRTMSGSFATPTAEKGEFMGIRIREIHIEEDPARWDPDSGLVDYNRSGYPLVEIVTEPDFISAEQVGEWVKHLITAFSYISAINPGAGIKCDVNVSTPGHSRVEVKNVNSVSGIMQAIKHEEERQATAKKKTQQTRSFDESTGTTVFMRSKENAEDYRFIPEPDLPVITLAPKLLNEIKEDLPEQPVKKFKRYSSILDKETAKALSDNIILAELFDRVSKKHDPKKAAPWIRRDVKNALSDIGFTRSEVDEKAQRLIEWLDLVLGKKIYPPLAKKLLPQVLKDDLDIKKHVKDEGLTMSSDDALIEQLCRESIEKNPKALEEYKKGKEKAFNSLVGYVMQKTKGKADPAKTAEILKKVIS